MAKPTQKELSTLRANYLAKREALLQKKVSTLSVKLFDHVFNNYLSALEKSDGIIVKNNKNISLVQGLDSIYKNFNTNDNIPVIRSFVGDLKGIIPLNERYFKNIAQMNVATTTERATTVTNKSLGLTSKGGIIQGGFIDKFISDQKLLKAIKKQTLKAVTSGKGFQDFRTDLQDLIVGDKQSSGGLQQYYRNYAYDTYQKVDRLNQEVFAKELGLRYFFWSGGLIKASRPLCVKANGMLVDSQKLAELTFDDLKEKYQDGLDDTWDPVADLGQYGCRHSKDYVTDAIAQRFSNKILNLNEIQK